jgi:hypothetical protein
LPLSLSARRSISASLGCAAAKRLIADRRDEIGHAERGALHRQFTAGFGRDDDRRRETQGFGTNTLMRADEVCKQRPADRRRNRYADQPGIKSGDRKRGNRQ